MNASQSRFINLLWLLLIVAFCGMCMGLVTLSPLIYGHIRQFAVGPNVVLSSVSPDGQYEAYVVDEPAIDGPDHSLFIQRTDDIHFVYVTELATDVDSVQAIYWSPESDLVVFQTQFSLFAVQIPGYHMLKIYLGKEWVRSEPGKGSRFEAVRPEDKVIEIAFPEPGVFAYRVDRSDELIPVQVNTLINR